MMISQIYCSVQDLVDDQQSAGASEARWYQAIRDASDFLQKEIGWFLPVRDLRLFDGRGAPLLFVPPLIEVVEIINDGITLSASDYLLNPEKKHWANGPYSWLSIAEDSENLSCWRDGQGKVSLDAFWGLYRYSQSTGATIGSTQSINATTLAVSDGGKISPGMVLLIGTEQELVTGWDDPTNTTTHTNAAVTLADSVITLLDASLVKRGEVIRVDFEQMKIRDIQDNRVSVLRGWNGSGVTTHNSATAVYVYRTATVERAVNGTTAAEHVSTTGIARYVAPDDIQYLTRQIATLMLNKSKGGYQGRSGNAETGVVFYNDSFPRDDLMRIKQNYFIPRAR